MGLFGMDYGISFWGFMAGFAETVGGFLLIAGLLFTPACALLIVTMLIALNMHLSNDDPFTTFSHAGEAAVMFLGLLITGPGKYSIDNILFFRKKRDLSENINT